MIDKKTLNTLIGNLIEIARKSEQATDTESLKMRVADLANIQINIIKALTKEE